MEQIVHFEQDYRTSPKESERVRDKEWIEKEECEKLNHVHSFISVLLTLIYTHHTSPASHTAVVPIGSLSKRTYPCRTHQIAFDLAKVPSCFSHSSCHPFWFSFVLFIGWSDGTPLSLIAPFFSLSQTEWHSKHALKHHLLGWSALCVREAARK